MLYLHGITLLDRDPLYRGGFTDIYHALYRGEEVALKRLRIFHHQKNQDRQRLRRRLTKEARVWNQLIDPHVLQFLGVDPDTFPSDLCVVSPWMRHGTILQFRKTYGASNINLERRLKEISLGINYLHLEGVIHGDLRGTNILISSDGTACLADFGLTDFIETLGQDSASHYQGSTRWLAPELIHPDDFALGKFQKTRATDIYAFAYVCLEIYTGKLPFIDVANDAEVIYQVIQGVRPRRPIIHDDTGVEIRDDLWDMIERCWEHQPSDRISITNVLQIFDNWNRGWDHVSIKLVETCVAQWIFDNQGHHLCWVENSGLARTSYIASTIAELCIREGRLAASVFFTRGPSLVEFFPKIVNQIARHIPAIEPLVRKVTREEPSMLSPSSTDGLQHLLLRTIVEPLGTLTGTMSPKVIVIDSLDLCQEASSTDNSWLTVEILIQAITWLAEVLHRNEVPLQLIVTSHPHLHREAKRSLPKFRAEARSLYLYQHGMLDSLTDGWKELQRLSAEGPKDSLPPSGDLTTTQDPMLEVAPGSLLSHISNWFDNNAGQYVCWLRYPVRQYGKRSSIAELMADQCASRGALAAKIFSSDSKTTSRTFLPTLAFQIGQSMPMLKSAMRQVIQDEREVILTTEDYNFARKLVIEPFLTGDFQLISPMIIVIDCIGWTDGEYLLNTLVWLEAAFRHHTIPLQIFITSEPGLYSSANLQFPAFLDNALTLHLPRFESSASLSYSRSLFVNHGQRVYQNLTSFLEGQISAEHAADQRVCNNFQAYLDHIGQLDTLQCLVESHRCRLQLLQLSTQIQVSEHPSVRECLQEDEAAIATLLEGLLMSDLEMAAILALRGDDAHSFLNLLQFVLSKGQLATYEIGRKARRLLVKLSEASEIIPASVLIRGLILIEPQPVSGGGFADIYRAMYRGQEVALKHLRVRQDQDSQSIRRAFGREALVWQQLKHPNVLTFLGIDSEVFPSSLCMVSPWMRHGTILDLRAANGPSNIIIEKRLNEIAEGLEYLHAEGVIHGDLRGANILVDNDWHAVLSDFGLTVFGDATVATHTSNPHGSIRWMAPELLNPEIFDLDRFIKTRASDVYAFACVCLEIYTGHHPFVDAANDAAVIYRVMQGQRPALRPQEQVEVVIPDHATEVVEWCWKQEPSQRPEIMDVVQIMKTWKCMV